MTLTPPANILAYVQLLCEINLHCDNPVPVIHQLRWFRTDLVIAHRVAQSFACTRADAATEVWVGEGFTRIDGVPGDPIVDVVE
jgi:hypothetical protein